MKSTLFSVAACLLLWGSSHNQVSGARAQASPPLAPLPILPSVVAVPTLGTDHQFDLDYTVAHLAAVLDAISPDGVIAGDYTDWLRAGCVWSATHPEYHVALRFTREKSIPIFGTKTRSSGSWYQGTVDATRKYMATHPDIASVREEYRKRLDQTTARIARDYSFNPEPQTLESLLRSGFASQNSLLSTKDREFIAAAARSSTDAILQTIASNPQIRRWAIVLPWSQALPIGELLRSAQTVRHMALAAFLPAAEEQLKRRMDAVHIAWILSGVLDEWYGMWAPQVYPSERVATLLRTLEKLAPHDAITRFLRARWLMQNRDYAGAEPLLRELATETNDARIAFPINPKWVRPPWSAIRDKAKLNLAFVYDVRGARDSALRLYQQLLQRGDRLNAEAQAAGYNFDDIHAVIESYTRIPYSGLPEEAYRHFPMTTGIPACDPNKPEAAEKQ